MEELIRAMLEAAKQEKVGIPGEGNGMSEIKVSDDEVVFRIGAPGAGPDNVDVEVEEKEEGKVLVVTYAGERPEGFVPMRGRGLPRSMECAIHIGGEAYEDLDFDTVEAEVDRGVIEIRIKRKPKKKNKKKKVKVKGGEDK